MLKTPGRDSVPMETLVPVGDEFFAKGVLYVET